MVTKNLAKTWGLSIKFELVASEGSVEDTKSRTAFETVTPGISLADFKTSTAKFLKDLKDSGVDNMTE